MIQLNDRNYANNLKNILGNFQNIAPHILEKENLNDENGNNDNDNDIDCTIAWIKNA